MSSSSELSELFEQPVEVKPGIPGVSASKEEDPDEEP